MEDNAQAAPVVTDTAVQAPAIADTASQAPAYDGPEWLGKYPDDVKNDRALWKYQSDEAATRALISAQRMIGMEKLPKPKGEFDPSNADWAPILDAMGRPKSADDYKFEEAKLPEGLAYDTTLEGKFKGIAHMAGLNGKQAQMMRDMFVAYQAETHTAGQTEFSNHIQSEQEALQKELGSAYEPYAHAATEAQKLFDKDQRFTSFLGKIGIDKHPEVMRFFGRLGKDTLPDTALKNGDANQFNTPADYRVQASKYQSENSHIIYSHGHPDQARVVAEWTRLMQLAYPAE